MNQYIEKISAGLRHDNRVEKLISEIKESLEDTESLGEFISLNESRINNLKSIIALQSEEIAEMRKALEKLKSEEKQDENIVIDRNIADYDIFIDCSRRSTVL